MARYKIVGQKGKIPDMVVNGWVIEYERTNKSAADCSSLFKYWTADKNKKVCLIYETEEIRNRYERAIIDKSKVVLLDRRNYRSMLNVLGIELPIKNIKEEIKVTYQEQESSNVTQKEGVKTFGNFSFD